MKFWLAGILGLISVTTTAGNSLSCISRVWTRSAFNLIVFAVWSTTHVNAAASSSTSSWDEKVHEAVTPKELRLDLGSFSEYPKLVLEVLRAGAKSSAYAAESSDAWRPILDLARKFHEKNDHYLVDFGTSAIRGLLESSKVYCYDRVDLLENRSQKSVDKSPTVFYNLASIALRGGISGYEWRGLSFESSVNYAEYRLMFERDTDVSVFNLSNPDEFYRKTVAVTCLVPTTVYPFAKTWHQVVSEILSRGGRTDKNGEWLTMNLQEGRGSISRLFAVKLVIHPSRQDYPAGMLARSIQENNRVLYKEPALKLIHFSSVLYQPGARGLRSGHYIPVYGDAALTQGGLFTNDKAATAATAATAAMDVPMVDAKATIVGVSAIGGRVFNHQHMTFPIFVSDTAPSADLLYTMGDSMMNGWPSVWVVLVDSKGTAAAAASRGAARGGAVGDKVKDPVNYSIAALAGAAWLRNIMTNLYTGYTHTNTLWKGDLNSYYNVIKQRMAEEKVTDPGYAANVLADSARRGFVCPKAEDPTTVDYKQWFERPAAGRTQTGGAGAKGLVLNKIAPAVTKNAKCISPWTQASYTKPHMFGQPFLRLPQVLVFDYGSVTGKDVEVGATKATDTFLEQIKKRVPNIKPDLRRATLVFQDPSPRVKVMTKFLLPNFRILDVEARKVPTHQDSQKLHVDDIFRASQDDFAYQDALRTIPLTEFENDLGMIGGDTTTDNTYIKVKRPSSYITNAAYSSRDLAASVFGDVVSACVRHLEGATKNVAIKWHLFHDFINSGKNARDEQARDDVFKRDVALVCDAVSDREKNTHVSKDTKLTPLVNKIYEEFDVQSLYSK
ncbi:hypothetical protein GNI_098880 [Gregarina niphandrodes]|uniref:Transmembrane protein n=1 Tax=Gregarina niphandrodes TaxID=110365 RepID=A0A023B4Y4_GRENI|nr:hypothetical protein GNI_098880 [Gregarina niphandrodes]EZG57173.1 hypothetical protein GNI_098880 [Gregarina niphandrodes]|eukprot:XP_011131078.1 hypothetical protein GNI_098880 [Gregarina niphandrodes]